MERVIPSPLHNSGRMKLIPLLGGLIGGSNCAEHKRRRDLGLWFLLHRADGGGGILTVLSMCGSDPNRVQRGGMGTGSAAAVRPAPFFRSPLPVVFFILLFFEPFGSG